MRRVAIVIVCLAFVAGALEGSGQPSILWTGFDPVVIQSGFTGAVRYEARIQGSPTQVLLVLNARDGSTSNRPLRDDGTAGDRTRGDGVYTVTLKGDEISSLLGPDDVLRVWIGYLDLYSGTARASRFNVFADVLTSEVGPYPVTRLAADAQRTDYLVNLVVPSFITGQGADLAPVTRRFYDLFPDEFDFLNLIAVPSYPANRTHLVVKNTVRGIGLQLSDRTSAFGSRGRLLGITVFPLATFFDGAERGHVHELGHQWINYLPCAPLSGGSPHWPLSDLASGVMGWSIGASRQGGEFPLTVHPVSGGARISWQAEPPAFSNLDLYLMGLLPATGVGTHYVFPPGTSFDELSGLATSGEMWRGTLIPITVEDVIRCVGPRIPSSEESPHRWRVATVIVSKDGLLSEDAMRFYSYFAQRAESKVPLACHVGFAKEVCAPFYVSTRGLGALDARIVR